MSWFTKKNYVHHFRLFFPIATPKIHSFIKSLQTLNYRNTSAICVSINGITKSPENAHLIHQSLIAARTSLRIPIYSFLEDKATALSYYAACSAQMITANPYCLIGDVASPQKSYKNISKLLQLMGLKYQQIGTNNLAQSLWGQLSQQSQKQKDITNKWLGLVQQNMVKIVSHRRHIDQTQVRSISNKLFTPQQALSQKLIDEVGTFEQFITKHYPQHQIQDYAYRFEGTKLQLAFSQKELSALNNFMQVLAMPKVALMSSQDPIKQCLDELLPLVQARLSNSNLDELQWALGELFAQLSSQLGQAQMMF